MPAKELLTINIIDEINEEALTGYLDALDAREAGRHESQYGTRISVVAKRRALGISEKAKMITALELIKAAAVSGQSSEIEAIVNNALENIKE